MDDLVTAIARRELGRPPATVRRVEEGLVHETYELRCDDEWYVLQVSDGEGHHDTLLENGLDCYVALSDSPIPVPDVVTERPGQVQGHSYALVERVAGETGEPEVTPARTRNAGQVLGALHDLARFPKTGWLEIEDPGRAPVQDDAVRINEFEAGSYRDRQIEKLHWSVETLRSAGLVDAAGAVARLESRLERAFSRSFVPTMVHMDFSPDNLAFQGETVAAVLDFAHAGHPDLDLANSANGFWMHDPCADWEVRQSFYDGYRELRDPETAFESYEPTFRALSLAETVASLNEKGELSEYEREFYGDRLSER